MKNKFIRFTNCSVCLIFVIMLLMCCSGCFFFGPRQEKQYEEREVGDFIVWFFEDYCEIYGTSEQGNTKKYLVIPEYIDGVRVDAFGYRSMLGGFDPGSYDYLTCPRIKSEELEKIYFESAINFYPAFWNGYIKCPNLKKVMYPIRDWRSDSTRGCDIYYPRSLNIGIQGYGAFSANVSFYYNYERDENSDYYWIDDCDYGGKIEYIPKDPVREGYAFGGWYKEPECINEWDFDSDTLPEEKTEQEETSRYSEDTGKSETIMEEVTVYQETILYAKWVEITPEIV